MKNIKNFSPLLGGAALLCTTTAGLAHKSVESYVGGHLGYISTQTKVSTVGSPDIGGGDRFTMSHAGANGGLHAGIGTFFDSSLPAYLGLEAIASLSNPNGKDLRGILNSPGAHKVQLKMSRSLTIAARLGMLVHKMVMPFIKIGATNSRWAFKSNYSQPGVVTANANKSKNLTGVLIGLGVDFHINDCLTLGLEAIHTRYRAFKLTHPNVAGAGDNAIYTIKPRTNTVNLRFSWKI